MEANVMDEASIVFYVLVIIGFIQVDRRLYDIVKALKSMRPS